MKYQMKIRPVFIDLIEKGIKKNEYRLNAIKYKDIKIGDTLVLISDIDSNYYIERKVKGIKVYKNFYDALKDTWDKDFNGLYNSLEEVVNVCNSFYKKFLICTELVLNGLVSTFF